MKKFILPVLMIIGVLGCDDDNSFPGSDCYDDVRERTFAYDTPTVINAVQNLVTLNFEQTSVELQLPPDVSAYEVQEYWFDTPIDCGTKKELDDLIPSGGVAGGQPGGFQIRHIFTQFEPPPGVVQYAAYRFRSIGQDGTSRWTRLRSIESIPLNQFESRSVAIPFHFSFVTEEIDSTYYSGTSVSMGINVDSLFQAEGIDSETLVAFRPLDGRGLSDDLDKFEEISFGFAEDIDPLRSRPIELSGELLELMMGNIESDVIFYPFGGKYLNLKPYFMDPQTELLLSYKLDDAEDYTGIEIDVTIIIEGEFYF